VIRPTKVKPDNQEKRIRQFLTLNLLHGAEDHCRSSRERDSTLRRFPDEIHAPLTRGDEIVLSRGRSSE